jgi:hypothetical protein
MIKGSRIQLLPIGSSPDNRRGIFYWQPGVGFLGHYRFVFVEKTADGQFTKKFVNMMITKQMVQENVQRTFYMIIGASTCQSLTTLKWRREEIIYLETPFTILIVLENLVLIF